MFDTVRNKDVSERTPWDKADSGTPSPLQQCVLRQEKSVIVPLGTKNHRTVWMGRKIHLILRPCWGKSHLPLDQLAQSLVQAGLEHLELRFAPERC